MKTKVLRFLIFVVTLFSIGAIITLLYNYPPSEKNILVIFYLSLFFTIFGVVFFVGYGINQWRYQALPPWQQTASVLRISLLLGLLAILIALVSSYIGLSWPLFLVLLALITLIEVFWRRRKGTLPT